MINEVIEQINDVIVDSGLIERWGGYCDAELKNGLMVGIGKTGDCKGNTYTFDDRVSSSGFIELGDVTNESISTQFGYMVIPVKIHLFVNQKRYDDKKYHSVYLTLMELFYSSLNFQRKTIGGKGSAIANIPHCEYTIITITVRQPIDCNYQVANNPDVC